MSHRDWLVLMWLGGAFILLGIISILWGMREERVYFNSVVTRRDVKEFFIHWPPRPEPEALKIGGWIAVILGLLMLLSGGILIWASRVI